jgi:hypothetical protein
MENPLVPFLPKTPNPKDDEGVKTFAHRCRGLCTVQQPPVKEGSPGRRREVGEADGHEHPEPHLPGVHAFASKVSSRLLLLVCFCSQRAQTSSSRCLCRILRAAVHRRSCNNNQKKNLQFGGALDFQSSFAPLKAAMPMKKAL